MSSPLIEFIGHTVVGALATLTPDLVLGPWRGHRPVDVRRQGTFRAALYPENHAHAHPELCLLVAGRCRFSLEGKSAVLETGDLVVLPAEVRHSESWNRAGESYQLVWWTLHPRDPSFHVTRYSARGGFQLEHRLSLAALPAEARARLEILRQGAQGGGAPEADALREALLTLALTLYRRVLKPGGRSLDTRAQLVQRAIEFVRAEGGRALTLAEVAVAAGVSPNYLTGLFRAETGSPLGKFILAERIGLAQKMLLENDASIKAVAFSLGFSDPFSFSRSFKSVTGQSPRQFQLAGGLGRAT